MGLSWSLGCCRHGQRQDAAYHPQKTGVAAGSEVSVDALQAKATATTRVDVRETFRKVPESGCHDVHEHPERSSLVPPQSWLDDRDAMQFNFGHGLGTVQEVPCVCVCVGGCVGVGEGGREGGEGGRGAKFNSYGTQMTPTSTGNKAGRPEDGVVVPESFAHLRAQLL